MTEQSKRSKFHLNCFTNYGYVEFHASASRNQSTARSDTSILAIQPGYASPNSAPSSSREATSSGFAASARRRASGESRGATSAHHATARAGLFSIDEAVLTHPVQSGVHCRCRKRELGGEFGGGENRRVRIVEDLKHALVGDFLTELPGLVALLFTHRCPWWIVRLNRCPRIRR